MDEKKQYNSKTILQQVVPSTRFGQALASLFYLKRHKKRDNYGRAPVVARLCVQSTLQIPSSSMPFEVLIPRKTSTPPPPIRVDSLK